MEKKKKASDKKKQEIKKSIAKGNARHKPVVSDSQEKLEQKMGQVAYKIGKVQQEMQRLQNILNKFQAEAQGISAELDKRGK